MSAIVENGIEAGTWNKYESRNPLQRWLVRRFLGSLAGLAESCGPGTSTAIDVGCGEGVTTALLRDHGLRQIRGLDFSAQIIDVARARNPGIPFETASIYDLDERYRSDFVSACEVLEHLERPELGLERLAAVCSGHCLLSVPNEPLFRGLNFCAGKYWSRWGNSPGHLNHWSSAAFVRFVATRFEIVQVRRPLPWTIVLARPKP
jgi:2-polyprenyl-3-methyl-5-hydroxy-6-metoxy-1,4-benzoquinol methylase